MHSPFDQFNTADSPLLFPVGLRNAGWEKRDGSFERIPANRVIVRLTQDGTSAFPLSVVSSTYKLVHNRELFNAIEDTMVATLPTAALAGVQVSDKIAYHGRNCYREYVFPGMRCDIGARSDIAFRIVGQNSYGGVALRVLSGAIEFYCSNGVVRGQYEQSYHRHTAGLRIKRIEHVLKHSVEQFWKDAETYREWTKRPVRHEKAMALFHAIANSPSFEDALGNRWVIEREERGSTVWSVFSAMTYYSSHNEGEFASRAREEAVPANMINRELIVSKWLQTPQWRELIDA